MVLVNIPPLKKKIREGSLLNAITSRVNMATGMLGQFFHFIYLKIQ